MTLQKFGTEVGRLSRQTPEQRCCRPRVNVCSSQHVHRIGICLRLVSSTVAEIKQLLGIRADVSSEQAD